MKLTTITVDPNRPETWPKGRINYQKFDATTEEEIRQHMAIDDAEAKKDAGRHIKRIRLRMGLSQKEMAQRIHVSLETVRNWEQGKRSPTGAARALLRILDKSPETALAALK